MKRKASKTVSLLAAAGIVSGAFMLLHVAGAGAADGADPVKSLDSVQAGSTYVEGARPAADADVSTGTGCVQYSPDRPDVHVCGPLPPGWTPDPAPYFDKAICEAAAQRVNYPDQVSASSAVHFPVGVEGNGPVEVLSCEIVQNGRDPLLDVVFVRNSGADNVHVGYAP